MTKNVMWISVDAPKRLESSVDSLKLCLGKEADVATFIAQGNEALHFYETVRKVKRISEPAAAYNAQLARVARCAQALASALDGLAPDPASVLGAQRSRRPYRELMTESQAFRDFGGRRFRMPNANSPRSAEKQRHGRCASHGARLGIAYLN